MKNGILLVLMALTPVMAVVAQEGQPAADPADGTMAPIEGDQLPPRVFEATVCADLGAEPTALPNGDFQYPTKPCKRVDYTTPPPPEPKPVAVPVVAPPLLDDLEQGTSAEQVAEPVPEQRYDYNQLQMMRLGELDARQGKPINMNHGGNLYYLQGYTKGQQERLNAPAGRGFGGMQGFGR